MRSGQWIVLLGLVAANVQAFGQGTYRGIAVAPERRCAPYDRADYTYPQSVEARIITGIGKVYGPYTGQCFGSARDTDIEHIVALSEAHDSGMCAASPGAKAQFARDLLNLTVASPAVNRYEKGAKDVSEWLPRVNACWFVEQTLRVRRKYGLSIDAREAQAAEQTLAQCSSTEMVVLECASGLSAPTVTRPEMPSGGRFDALKRWDDNGNGRITCEEARRHGIAPVQGSHPAYPFMRDGDGDGVVCE